MVATTELDRMTWYRCEKCGLLVDSELDAKQHEECCDGGADSPSYWW